MTLKKETASDGKAATRDRGELDCAEKDEKEDRK